MFKRGDRVIINDNPVYFEGRLVLPKKGQDREGIIVGNHGPLWIIDLSCGENVFDEYPDSNPESNYVAYDDTNFTLVSGGISIKQNPVNPELIHPA